MSDEYISPQELHTQLATPDAPFVIDVRGADEYAAGHIAGARHIPGDELGRRLDEVPRDQPIVAY